MFAFARKMRHGSNSHESTRTTASMARKLSTKLTSKVKTLVKKFDALSNKNPKAGTFHHYNGPEYGWAVFDGPPSPKLPEDLRVYRGVVYRKRPPPQPAVSKACPHTEVPNEPRPPPPETVRRPATPAPLESPNKWLPRPVFDKFEVQFNIDQYPPHFASPVKGPITVSTVSTFSPSKGNISGKREATGLPTVSTVKLTVTAQSPVNSDFAVTTSIYYTPCDTPCDSPMSPTVVPLRSQPLEDPFTATTSAGSAVFGYPPENGARRIVNLTTPTRPSRTTVEQPTPIPVIRHEMAAFKQSTPTRPSRTTVEQPTPVTVIRHEMAAFKQSTPSTAVTTSVQQTQPVRQATPFPSFDGDGYTPIRNKLYKLWRDALEVVDDPSTIPMLPDGFFPNRNQDPDRTPRQEHYRRRVARTQQRMRSHTLQGQAGSGPSIEELHDVYVQARASIGETEPKFPSPHVFMLPRTGAASQNSNKENVSPVEEYPVYISPIPSPTFVPNNTYDAVMGDAGDMPLGAIAHLVAGRAASQIPRDTQEVRVRIPVVGIPPREILQPEPISMRTTDRIVDLIERYG